MIDTLNAAACLRNAHYLGFTRIYNICTGAVNDVPWGSADWLIGVVFLLALLACLTIGILFIIIMLHALRDA